MSLNKQRLLDWIGAGIFGTVIGFFFSEIKSPVIEYQIETFGSPEEKMLQDYRKMRTELQKDSTLQKALSWQTEKDSIIAANDSIRRSWQAEKDSLERFYKHQAIRCIKREIKRGKEKPCESSIYYFRGILASGTNWRVGSTECLKNFHIPVYGADIPVSLLDQGWVNKYFPYRSRIRQKDVARKNKICGQQ